METRSVLPHLEKSGSAGCGEGRRAELRRARGRKTRLGVCLDVVFTDASAGTGAFHVVDVDAEFARQSPNMRSRGNRFAMFRAGNLAQLRGHGELPAGGLCG